MAGQTTTTAIDPLDAARELAERSILDLASLQGKNAVVTGAARGIGRAIAKRLADAGATVVLGDLDAEEAGLAASALAGEGKRAIGVGADALELGSVEQLAEAAVSEFGAIDIWVNNVGIYPTRPLLTMTPEEWDNVMQVNLRGTFFGAQVAARQMIEQGRGGVIINIASTSGHRALYPGLTAYAASKAAVRGFTRNLALELGPEGIRVLAISPGYIMTEGAAASSAEANEARRVLVERLPLKRPGIPDEIARVVVFCASDLAAYMTGGTLLVEGGMLVH
jgi:NAD(P)-dependent dehydrogenase (short-subunit alcohol dehydrogenase family)